MPTKDEHLAIRKDMKGTCPIYTENVFVRTKEIFYKSSAIELVLYCRCLQRPIALQQLKELLTPGISQH